MFQVKKAPDALILEDNMMIKDHCLHPVPHIFLKIPTDYVIDYAGRNKKKERGNDSNNLDEGLFAVTNEIIE